MIGFNIAPNIVKYPDILSGSIDDPDIGNNKVQINAVFLEGTRGGNKGGHFPY